MIATGERPSLLPRAPRRARPARAAAHLSRNKVSAILICAVLATLIGSGVPAPL